IVLDVLVDGSSVGAVTTYTFNNVTATHTIAPKFGYNFTGFFRPVDNYPTLNVVKAGSAVPVKFSLDGYQGLNIFAAGYPASFEGACDASVPQDLVDETVTAGGSSLSYDSTTGQYIYVWKTDKGWGNKCRQLVVKLSDGTVHWTNFKFTK
ncbi:MAG TPA: PxKF domain-containing protein, partial [Candidatus Binatia bacterium]